MQFVDSSFSLFLLSSEQLLSSIFFSWPECSAADLKKHEACQHLLKDMASDAGDGIYILLMIWKWEECAGRREGRRRVGEEFG